jgi:hypothetical protein
MTWTTTPPTAPGWYWYRSHSFAPQPCQVVNTYGVWLVGFILAASWHPLHTPDPAPGAEWAGPITPPA